MQEILLVGNPYGEDGGKDKEVGGVDVVIGNREIRLSGYREKGETKIKEEINAKLAMKNEKCKMENEI